MLPMTLGGGALVVDKDFVEVLVPASGLGRGGQDCQAGAPSGERASDAEGPRASVGFKEARQHI